MPVHSLGHDNLRKHDVNSSAWSWRALTFQHLQGCYLLEEDLRRHVLRGPAAAVALLGGDLHAAEPEVAQLQQRPQTAPVQQHVVQLRQQVQHLSAHQVSACMHSSA